MSFLKKLSATKAAPATEKDKKFYEITCLAGAGIAFVSMVILLILLAGYDPTYVWSTLALGIFSLIFFGLAFCRYFLAGAVPFLDRIGDASVYLLLFGAYTPIQLILIRTSLYENGSIVTGWVTFGITAFFCALFFILSLVFPRKFRFTGSIVFFLLTFSLLFGAADIFNVFYFAPALGIIFMVVAILAFAASPVIFWFFDKHAWQMKVFYILLASGTFAASLLSLLYAICGR